MCMYVCVNTCIYKSLEMYILTYMRRQAEFNWPQRHLYQTSHLKCEEPEAQEDLSYVL